MLTYLLPIAGLLLFALVRVLRCLKRRAGGQLSLSAKSGFPCWPSPWKRQDLCC